MTELWAYEIWWHVTEMRNETFFNFQGFFLKIIWRDDCELKFKSIFNSDKKWLSYEHFKSSGDMSPLVTCHRNEKQNFFQFSGVFLEKSSEGMTVSLSLKGFSIWIRIYWVMSIWSLLTCHHWWHVTEMRKKTFFNFQGFFLKNHLKGWLWA